MSRARSSAVAPDEPVRPSLLLVIADGAEACLRERAERRLVLDVDARDARNRLVTREDDVVDEPAQRLRADAATRQVGLPDEEIDAGDISACVDERVVLGIVRDEVRLDHSGIPA